MANPAPTRLRLAPSQRLKLGREFARAKAKGQRVVHGCMVMNWVTAAEGEGLRLGVITTRKIGSAVERNRARRLLRESFRLHQHDFERPVDLVLVARNSIVGKKFAEVENDFQEGLRCAGLLRKTT